MSVFNKHSVWVVVLALLATASLLLRGSLLPNVGNSYIESDLGQGFSSAEDSRVGAKEPEQETRGSLHGVIVDEDDSPAQGLEVELIPANKSGNERWYATKREWTTADGEYQFSDAEPGEYFVAIQKRSAPDARHPFARAYYPGVNDESEGDRVLVTQSGTTELVRLRMHRLETVTLKVRVAFEDGTSPPRSNLLFHNLSYPDQAVIGDVAPEFEEGQGVFTIPKGFEYSAQAKVDCESGTRIETRESRPVQRIRAADGHVPEELVFTISGPTCKLWSPR